MDACSIYESQSNLKMVTNIILLSLYFVASFELPPPFNVQNMSLYRNYGHVWSFLKVFNLPYCTLYDQGYTSLGKTTDTLPNPALKKLIKGDSHIQEYWPAYMLSDWTLERAGR